MTETKTAQVGDKIRYPDASEDAIFVVSEIFVEGGEVLYGLSNLSGDDVGAYSGDGMEIVESADAVSDQAVETEQQEQDTEQEAADLADPPEPTEGGEPAEAEEPDDEEGDDEPTESILGQLHNAEMEIRRRERRVEDLKEDLKEAKAELDGAVTRLRRMVQGIENDADRPLLASSSESDNSSEATPANGSDQSDTLNGWQDQPTADWIRGLGLKGFGAKKVEAFIEVCPTFVAIENMRTKASIEGVHLSQHMPKGIGEGLTDTIENAYLDLVSTPFEHPAISRSEELLAEDELTTSTDPEIWQEGWSAWEAGQNLGDCPFGGGQAEDRANRDDWIRGWLSCDRAPAAEEAEPVDLSDAPVVEQSTEEPSIDDQLAEI